MPGYQKIIYTMRINRIPTGFTYSELATIYHKMHLKTYEQIGIALKTSNRTIENYILSLKRKTSSYYLSDIVDTLFVHGLSYEKLKKIVSKKGK